MRILVIGDIILDQYLFCGRSTRHNPEHPEGIILPVKSWQVSLGGAAGVAYLLKQFGVDVRLVGVFSRDWAGQCVSDLVTRYEIPTTVWQLDNRVTTTKIRVVREGHIVGERLDFERCDTIERSLAPLIEQVTQNWMPDAIVIADYNKGTCREDDMAQAIACGIPCFVDPPRGRWWMHYRGAAVLKCNWEEARDRLHGDPYVPETAADTARMTSAINDNTPVIVTHGDQGMAWSDGQVTESVPAVAPWRNQDPCGCGDTVIAVLACLRTAGASWGDSMRAAAACAAEQIGHWGVHAVSLPPDFRHMAEWVSPEPGADQVREPRPALGNRPAILPQD